MKKQILVIDDSLPICRLLRSALQSDTVDVHYFTRVADALDSFMKHRYCLVIMDISVEGADGMELLQTIFQAKHVPILVITEDLNPDKGMKLLDAGATVCIRKPFALSVCSSQVANTIIVDVYSKIAGISTVLAGLMSAVAVVGAKISNNQHKVDQAWDWLKRIWIAWAIINGIGAFIAYVAPFFSGLATLTP